MVLSWSVKWHSIISCRQAPDLPRDRTTSRQEGFPIAPMVSGGRQGEWCRSLCFFSSRGNFRLGTVPGLLESGRPGEVRYRIMHGVLCRRAGTPTRGMNLPFNRYRCRVVALTTIQAVIPKHGTTVPLECRWRRRAGSYLSAERPLQLCTQMPCEKADRKGPR